MSEKHRSRTGLRVAAALAAALTGYVAPVIAVAFT